MTTTITIRPDSDLIASFADPDDDSDTGSIAGRSGYSVAQAARFIVYRCQIDAACAETWPGCEVVWNFDQLRCSGATRDSSVLRDGEPSAAQERDDADAIREITGAAWEAALEADVDAPDPRLFDLDSDEDARKVGGYHTIPGLAMEAELGDLDEPTTRYRVVWDDGDGMLDATTEEEAEVEAKEATEEWAEAGAATTWIDYRVQECVGEEDGGPQWETVSMHRLTLDPDEPDCIDGEDHDWRPVPTGCKESPGVWGHGGGVMIIEYCARCGCAKTIDTWASHGAEQGLHSVSYEPHRYDDLVTDDDSDDEPAAVPCTIAERGNGFPDVGDYVAGDDGEVYVVVTLDSTIHTGARGEGNWMRATVESADWSDVDDNSEPVCSCVCTLR